MGNLDRERIAAGLRRIAARQEVPDIQKFFEDLALTVGKGQRISSLGRLGYISFLEAKKLIVITTKPWHRNELDQACGWLKLNYARPHTNPSRFEVDLYY